jgi:hypothetical protein
MLKRREQLTTNFTRRIKIQTHIFIRLVYVVLYQGWQFKFRRRRNLCFTVNGTDNLKVKCHKNFIYVRVYDDKNRIVDDSIDKVSALVNELQHFKIVFKLKVARVMDMSPHPR